MKLNSLHFPMSTMVSPKHNSLYDRDVLDDADIWVAGLVSGHLINVKPRLILT